jgi:hypothetical protein
VEGAVFANTIEKQKGVYTMKKLKKIAAALLLVALTGCTTTLPTTTTTAEPLPPPGAAVSFQFFYDNLSPYGAWVSYPGYGYAWAPRVAGGFRPYFSSGQWVMTDLGWTWVSYYDWGWAPFHYGSWVYDPFYGWLWVPGYNWAPAWVTWGYYDGYYGWAPLVPVFHLALDTILQWTIGYLFRRNMLPLQAGTIHIT